MATEAFRRPPDFDLAEYWRTGCTEQGKSRSVYAVTARVAPRLVPELPWRFGDVVAERIAQAGPADAEGWITLELPFESLDAARERLLSLGGAVEVLAPRALRASLADYARQIVGVYG